MAHGLGGGLFPAVRDPTQPRYQGSKSVGFLGAFFFFSLLLFLSLFSLRT
jgi:hypothetical protein